MIVGLDKILRKPPSIASLSPSTRAVREMRPEQKEKTAIQVIDEETKDQNKVVHDDRVIKYLERRYGKRKLALSLATKVA